MYVITTVPQDAHNRSLCVAVDGPMYRSSCRELDAQRATVTAEWVFTGLTGGEYVAEAALGQKGGAVQRATAPFRVIGLEEDGLDP